MGLEEALKIVRENGYIAIKPTNTQVEDMDKCEECGFSPNCIYCSFYNSTSISPYPNFLSFFHIHCLLPFYTIYSYYELFLS